MVGLRGSQVRQWLVAGLPVLVLAEANSSCAVTGIRGPDWVYGSGLSSSYGRTR